MDEDILSDIVPSNIVSRQVSPSSRGHSTCRGANRYQVSDGESEYADDVESEKDELIDDSMMV